ncbi:MAG: phosphonate metabolism transcriptional regulator PhnF [Sneathiellaceae bacterium]
MGESSNAAKAPRWRQIETALRAELAGGRFGPGERLPGEHALAGRFGTTRNTVRRALSEMQAAGLLRIVHGQGCFVREEPIIYEIGERTRLTENLLTQNAQGARRLLSARTEVPSAEIAAALQLPRGTGVTMLEVTIEADDRILGYGKAWFDAGRFPGIEDCFRQSGSFSRALAMFGVADYRRSETSMIARLPTKAEARILKQLPTQPVIEQEKLDIDAAGRPLSYGVAVYAAERIRFVVRRDGPGVSG